MTTTKKASTTSRTSRAQGREDYVRGEVLRALASLHPYSEGPLVHRGVWLRDWVSKEEFIRELRHLSLREIEAMLRRLIAEGEVYARNGAPPLLRLRDDSAKATPPVSPAEAQVRDEPEWRWSAVVHLTKEAITSHSTVDGETGLNVSVDRHGERHAAVLQFWIVVRPRSLQSDDLADAHRALERKREDLATQLRALGAEVSVPKARPHINGNVAGVLNSFALTVRDGGEA